MLFIPVQDTRFVLIILCLYHPNIERSFQHSFPHFYRLACLLIILLMSLLHKETMKASSPIILFVIIWTSVMMLLAVL